METQNTPSPSLGMLLGSPPFDEVLGLRPEVLALALAMEDRLRAHEDKGDWKADGWPHLLDLLETKLGELDAACGDLTRDREAPVRVGICAADLANYAMMVADVAGGLDLHGAVNAAQSVMALGTALLSRHLNPLSTTSPQDPDR